MIPDTPLTLHQFGWIVGTTLTLIGSVVGVQKYIKSLTDPTHEMTKKNDMAIIQLSNDFKHETIRSQEHWLELRSTLEGMRLKLHEMTINQTEMKTALFGANGANGINGTIKQINADLRELRDRLSQVETHDER